MTARVRDRHREAAAKIVDEIAGLVTDAIAVNCSEWNGCDFDAGPSLERIATLLAETEAAALERAAAVCLAYSRSGVNVYRRQVAHACERRIRALIEADE